MIHLLIDLIDNLLDSTINLLQFIDVKTHYLFYLG